MIYAQAHVGDLVYILNSTLALPHTLCFIYDIHKLDFTAKIDGHGPIVDMYSIYVPDRGDISLLRGQFVLA